MKGTDKLMQIAAKLWPIEHRNYREMCVLAATGQLGGPQMHELNAHIAVCRSCRSLLESMAQLSSQVMPLLADGRLPANEATPPRGMRERLLSRLACEDLASHCAPRHGTIPLDRWKSLASAPAPKRCREEETGANRAQRKGQFPRVPLLGRAAVFAAACGLAAFLGFYAGKRRVVHGPPLVAAAADPSIALVPRIESLTREAERVPALEREKSSLDRELSTVRGNLERLEQQRQALSAELSDTQTRLATLSTQATRASRRSAAEIQGANTQIAALRSRIDFLDQRLADSEINAYSQQEATDRLSAKLQAAEAELRRESELKSAKLEMGDLAAARNLHIVDVYDADATGARKQAFGRVFYVEGKSLVFYAYDLNDRGRFEANVIFHVWGGKTGEKEVTRSLGILRQDTGAESRWTMTFDDPTVLAQINSVFVTAETAGKHYNRPHGRKILFAFLGGQPNHP